MQNQHTQSNIPDFEEIRLDRLTLPKAARELGISPATVARWATRGVRGIRLQTFLLGGRRFTTRALIERFMAETTEAAESRCNEAPMPQLAGSSQDRRVAIEMAKSRLAAAGF